MGGFWQKPAFWLVLFIIITSILIPLIFYFFKKPILSLLPADLTNNTQPVKLAGSAGPGKCLILEEQYCSQGEVIYTKNSQGGPEIYIGFNDLPDNMPIFAGRKGQKLPVKLAPGSEFQGFRVTVMDANLGFSPSEVAFGVIGDLDLGNTLSLPVEKGDIVAKIKNTGIKNLGYSLLITVRNPNIGSKTAVPNKQILQELFPKIK